MKKYLPIFLITFFCIQSLYSSVKRTGFSFIQNYSKEIYHGGTQVWSISQDKQGMMYFGNNSGLMTFDGTYWNLFPVPNGSIIRSIRLTHDGKIYVGASSEFGYFKPNTFKGLEYISLADKVPAKYSDFGEIWNIVEYQGGIIFHSFNALFYYKNDSIKVLSYERNLHFSFMVDSTLYLREIGKGLVKLEGLNLTSLKGTEITGYLTVTGMCRYDERSILVSSREQGLFLLTDKGIAEFKTSFQQYFSDNQIFSLVPVGNDFFAIGTVQDGVVIIDRDGMIVQHSNRERGLQNNTVLSMFLDIDKNLWLGLDNGIDLVLLNSPLSYFAHQNDVGAVYAIERKGDFLYLGTNQGLFYINWPENESGYAISKTSHFIEGSQGQVWTLYKKGDVLFMGHDKGTFIVDKNKLSRISSVDGGWTFVDVPGHPEWLIEGTYYGVILYENIVNKGWISVGTIPGFSQSCKEICFDDRGYLWVGHGYKGIFRLQFTNNFDSIIEVKHYSQSNGLPTNYNLNVHKYNNQVIVSSNQGIYLFDYSTGTFAHNDELSKLFENANVFSLITDQQGDVWYFSADGMGIIKPNFDGTYTTTGLPFASLKNKLIATYESIYSIDRSNILIPCLDGVIDFDPTFSKDYTKNFSVIVSRVVTLPDSILFSGDFNFKIPGKLTAIDFQYNQLRFSYSALSYEKSLDINYRYMLEGFDTDWSEWNAASEKEYTNLHEGEYRFKVQAKNIYGKVSEAVPYEFRILPPFYRSTIAYIFYALLLAFAMGISAFLIYKKFEKEKHKLKEKQKQVLKEKEKVFEEASNKAEQEIIRLRNEKLEAENQKSHAELDSKNKELASITMHITYKNELLNRVKQKLTRVSEKMLHLEMKKQVIELVKTLEKDLAGHDDWEKFEVHFDQVHEDFLKKLRKNYIELTPKDLRLCAYLKMNLSSKEIAPLLNISVRGVEISRYRLRKKMGLPRDSNLTEFMMNI
jgi:DNA-binding CsgD family transcriptional regulator